MQEPRFQYRSIRINRVELPSNWHTGAIGTRGGLDAVWSRISSGICELKRVLRRRAATRHDRYLYHCDTRKQMSTSQNTYLSLSTDESTSGSFGGTSYSALSLTGNVRTSNQDSFGLAFVEDGHLIAAVADGMGGHAGGDLASSSAISIFFENMIVERGEDLRKHINLLISQVANRLSEIEPTSPQYSGMGTTLSVVVVEGSKLTTAHISDSRIYRIRNGKLTQLTSDHSWVQQQVEAGSWGSSRPQVDVNDVQLMLQEMKFY